MAKGNNTAARREKLIEQSKMLEAQKGGRVRTDILPRYLAGSTYMPRTMRKGRRG